MIIDFKRKPRSRSSATARRLSIDDISTAVDPVELAATEAADEIKLEQQEQRRQARVRGEIPPVKQKAPSGFIMVPLAWVERLNAVQAPLSAWKLALALLYRANLKEEFPATDAFLVKAGVGRKLKRDLLGRLEKAGLAAIELRPPPKAPLVTVLRRPRHFRGRS
jgi:hypothetical protein